MKSIATVFLLSALALGGLAVAGCGGSPEADQADRDDILAVIEAYLPLLANAYAESDFEPLHQYAAEKEVAIVSRWVNELAEGGRTLEPQLEEITLEEVTTWNYANALATTLEVWSVRNMAIGTDTVLSESRAKPNRVVYQLKRRDTGWQILSRQVKQTLE